MILLRLTLHSWVVHDDLLLSEMLLPPSLVAIYNGLTTHRGLGCIILFLSNLALPALKALRSAVFEICPAKGSEEAKYLLNKALVESTTPI
jgi:hypothetical protein